MFSAFDDSADAAEGVQQVQLFVAALDHLEVGVGNDLGDPSFLDVLHSLARNVKLIQLVYKLLNVITVQDQVLGEGMDVRVVLSLRDLIVDVFDHAFLHHARYLFDFGHGQWLIRALDKRRTGLQGVDASPQITFRDFDQGVQDLV